MPDFNRNFNTSFPDRQSSVNEYAFGSPFNFAGKGPRDYRRKDEYLYEDVCEALFDSHEIDASEMEVAVKEGVVTLSGVVEDRTMKWQAEDLVESIAGVKDVRNELQTKRPRGFLSQLTGDGRSHRSGLIQNKTGLI